MKLYEYAASGLPVVAREALKQSVGPQPFVYFYPSHAEISRIVTEVLSTELARSSIQSQALPQSWTVKAKSLLRFSIELLEGV